METRKCSIIILLIVTCWLQLNAQTPVPQFWMQNQSPDNLIWDNTAWNNQVDNGSGTLTMAATQWATKTGRINYKWITCKNAVFGGNPGVGAAGTITLGGILNNVKSISFYPAASGDFTLTGQSITTNCFSDLPVFVDTGLNTTVASVFSGTNGITKNGTGKLILTGTNTYSGTTTIAAGILQIDNGGTTGQLGGSNNVVNNASLVVNRSNSYTIANPISGSGSFTDNSAGTIVLTGNNTYTGTTYINQGTIQIGNNGTAGHIVNSSNIVSSDNTNLQFQRTDNINFTVPMSGTGNMIQAGSGTTTITVGNTFTGFTFLNEGNLTLDYQSASPIMSAASGLKFNGGILSPKNLGANTQVFAQTIINSDITNKIVRGVNYTSGLLDLGNISVISGVLDISDIQTTPSWVKCNTLNAGALLGTSVTTNNGANTVGTDANGYLIIKPSDDYSQGGAIASDGSKAARLVATGIGGNVNAASVTLATAGTTNRLGILNAYSATNGNSYIPLDITNGNILRLASNGGITNAAGTTLQIRNGTLTAGSADNTNGLLNINATNNINMNSVIANNGSGVVDILKTGAGQLVLNSDVTATGKFTVNAGSLWIPNTRTMNCSEVEINNSVLYAADISYQNPNMRLGSVLTLNNSTLSGWGSGTGDGQGTISSLINIVGTNNLINWGDSKGYIQALRLPNGMKGNGTVAIGNNPNQDFHVVYINGSMSGFSGTIKTRSTISSFALDIESVDGWGTGATLLMEGGSSVGVNYAGQFQTRNGTGATKVASDINTPTNKLNVTGGTFSTSYNLIIGSLAGTGGAINIAGTGKILTAGKLNLDESCASVIKGAGGMGKDGTGNMTLSGNNTYSGGTNIIAGSLTAAHINAFGTGTITINAGATLNKNGYAITNTIINNGGTIIP